MEMKRSYIYILFMFISLSVSAQEWEVKWNAETDFLGGTGEILPFWARTGRDGIVPAASSALVIGGADVSYAAQNGLYFEAGTNLVGNLTSRNSSYDTFIGGIVDRLYVSGGWKMLHLDVGMKPHLKDYNELSVTGGNYVCSRNARNMPGINFWTDWIYFEKGHWFGVKGNFSHYQTLDNRYVKRAMIHNKELAFKAALGRKVYFILGLEHWAQWGGTSPKYGRQPSSFRDYYRVVLSLQGGSDATIADQVNALGNHLGRVYAEVDWRTEAFNMSFRYQMPFEDAGGLKKIQNVPDGVYGIDLSFAGRKAFVTDVTMEFISTTWQAGDVHDRPATEEEMAGQNPLDPYYGRVVVGGLDNYFNHMEYRSGWTNYGRIIGLPLILPAAPDADGIVTTMASTRVRGAHLGIRGNMLEDLPYIFKATYSSNWGKYEMSSSSIFHTRPWQLSLALELEFGKKITNLPMTLAVGAYGDIGKLYQNSFGLTLRIRYHDSRRF